MFVRCVLYVNNQFATPLPPPPPLWITTTCLSFTCIIIIWELLRSKKIKSLITILAGCIIHILYISLCKCIKTCSGSMARLERWKQSVFTGQFFALNTRWKTLSNVGQGPFKDHMPCGCTCLIIAFYIRYLLLIFYVN